MTDPRETSGPDEVRVVVKVSGLDHAPPPHTLHFRRLDGSCGVARGDATKGIPIPTGARPTLLESVVLAPDSVVTISIGKAAE